MVGSAHPTNVLTIYLETPLINEKQIISCRAEPAEPLVCGELVTCTLVVSVAEDILPSGCIRFHFTESPYYRIPPNYGLPAKGFVFFARHHFQTDNPQAAGYVTAETGSGQRVSIKLAPGRCFFTIACAGGLTAGETLVVRIGDKRAGSPGIEVTHHPTYGGWQLVCDLDRQGDGNFVRQDLMPHIRVIAAPAQPRLGSDNVRRAAGSSRRPADCGDRPIRKPCGRFPRSLSPYRERSKPYHANRV